MHAVSLAHMQNMTPHVRTIHDSIRAAVAAFKGNIYKKHICSQIFLPHHCKNIEI
jgi:hypothetical protein